MKTAVIFSPGAGQKQRFAQIGQILLDAFGAAALLTCPGQFGADYLPGVTVAEAQLEGGYVQRLQRMTQAVLAHGPQLLVSVGGDGIASYIADAMLTSGVNIPMMGVAAGTANVGPIVCISPEELAERDLTAWDYLSVGAVEVLSDGHVGYAVNDVVIGNTLLGTQDGQVVNLSAEAMALRGEKKVIAVSSRICSENFTIIKNGRVAAHRIHPGQIIVSAMDRDRLEGRAIYGALCSCAYSPCKGAIALTEQVMICAEAEDAGMEDFCAIEHLLFGPEDQVTLSGFTADAQLILDGNPYIRTAQTVQLRFHPQLLTVAVPKPKS